MVNMTENVKNNYKSIQSAQMVTLISAFYIVSRSCIHVQRTPIYLHCSTLSLLVKDKWKNLKFQPCEYVFKRIKNLPHELNKEPDVRNERMSYLCQQVQSAADQ